MSAKKKYPNGSFTLLITNIGSSSDNQKGEAVHIQVRAKVRRKSSKKADTNESMYRR